MKIYTIFLLLFFIPNIHTNTNTIPTNTTGNLLFKITGTALIGFGVVNIIDQYKKKNYSWKKSLLSVIPLICGALCFPSVRNFNHQIMQSIYNKCYGTPGALQKDTLVKNIPQVKRVLGSNQANDIIVFNNKGLINTGIIYDEMDGNKTINIGPKGLIELDTTIIDNCSNASLELKITSDGKTSINNKDFTLQQGNYRWNGTTLEKSS